MKLWIYWKNAIQQLRPAFSRTISFMWFMICAAGFTVRTDFLGVTSIIRALGLHNKYYTNLLNFFHSRSVKIDDLTALWTRIVLQLLGSHVVRVNGRIVLIGDGIKVAKQGKKMPAVKSLHQESESNSKPEYIMGHSFQAISVLIKAADSHFAVPLAARIHEGLVFSNRSLRTLLDKMIDLISTLKIHGLFYFVSDNYYASRKIVKPLIKKNNHIVSRVRTNGVAWEPAPIPSQKRRGRRKKYGKKIRLQDHFKDSTAWLEMDSPVYGEKSVTIRYKVIDALWKPAEGFVRFVLVHHPVRGQCILMTTDLTLEAETIIRLYGLRFKIEHAFKQAIHVIGTFGYHFWMKAMTPIKRRGGDQYMHHKSDQYREAIKRKMNAYHVYVTTGVVAHGLMHYLATCHSKLVWNSFGSWLRTIRENVPPSERVVAMALRNRLPEFLVDKEKYAKRLVRENLYEYSRSEGL